MQIDLAIKKQVIIETNDFLLSSNSILIKSVAILWYSGSNDLLFIPKNNIISLIIKQNNKEMNVIENMEEINCKTFEKLKFDIKLSCNLSIIEQSKPQTGSFEIAIDHGKYSIRASFHPTNNGECLCLRIIRGALFDLPNTIERHLNYGLNIIGGKTCSGKTTMMYGSITKFKGHVITLEDPVEIHIKNISQTDVTMFGFEEGIKSALRNSPDLICIGEIRSEESAKAAIKAALTGHTVLATIHIASANNLISRLKEMNCNFFDEVLNNIFFMENFQKTHYQFKNGKIIKIHETNSSKVNID